MEKFNCFQNISSSLEDAIEYRNKIRQKGKSFVLTNGCFDLLHAGHVYSLIEAKRLGDCLWIALNSDKSVKNLKGKNRPIIKQDHRAFLLKNLSVVSGITIFDTIRLDSEIMALKPDIYVKSGDYDESTIAKEELSALKCVNAKIQFVPFLKYYSTSSLIENICSINEYST